MRFNIIGLFICLLFSVNLSAQKAMPVKWSFDLEKISDKEYNIVCTADIKDGWYLYAQKQESDLGPIPTSFSFTNEDEFQLIGEFEEQGEKIEKFDNYFDMNISKYANQVKFVQRIKKSKKAKAVAGSVEFMTCDDNQCLPPTNIEFALNFD